MYSQRTLFLDCSCMKLSVFVTAWWPWVPVAQARASALTFLWRPWVTAVLHIERCAWIQKLSLRRRCLEGLTWLPMIGLMAYSPLSGERLLKQRKVCYQLLLFVVLNKTHIISGHLAVWVKSDSYSFISWLVDKANSVRRRDDARWSTGSVIFMTGTAFENKLLN